MNVCSITSRAPSRIACRTTDSTSYFEILSKKWLNGAVTESYVQTVLTAFSEVETQLAAERFLMQQQTALAAASEQSVAAQRLAEQRYSSGLADILLVLQSQRDAALAQSSLLTVRRQLLDARVDLHLALGGDFES